MPNVKELENIYSNIKSKLKKSNIVADVLVYVFVCIHVLYMIYICQQNYIDEFCIFINYLFKIDTCIKMYNI